MNYYEKDKIKFSQYNKLITRGVIGSSSYKYAIENPFGLIINPNEFYKEDIVGVSVNGTRKNRISFDKELVLKAINNGCTIIKDNSYNTNRPFNIGERELESFLIANGCKMIEDTFFYSSWRKA